VGQGIATFTFTATEENVTYECRLDGGSWSPCTSPTTYEGLLDGTHTFDVRAKDAAGNEDPTPATHTWTVDTVSSGDNISFRGSGCGICSSTGGGASLVVMALGTMAALLRRRRARR
jgi:large repetitive protein